MNFGKYAILGSITHHFELEPEWTWTIKPITSGMELERSKFMLHNRVVADVNGNRRELPPTWLEVAYREIALTFGGTNVPKDEDKSTPLLGTDAPIPEIEACLRQMPQEMVEEIWKAIGQAFPKWGPADPNEL